MMPLKSPGRCDVAKTYPFIDGNHPVALLEPAHTLTFKFADRFLQDVGLRQE